MKYIFILLSSILMSSSCSPQNGRLPDVKPADFSLNYHVDGGMRYYSENLYLSKDSCIYTVNDEGKITIKKFLMNGEEMNGLYEMLRKHKFGMIESVTKEKIYDRGGISINTSWNHNTKQLAVSDAQMTFVKEKWRKEWEAVCTWLQSLAAKKTN